MTATMSMTKYLDLVNENARLRAALFKIQCEQLERSSNRNLTAIGLRRLALRTRNEIIEVLGHQQSTAGSR